jgi:hypothetical protein
MAFDDGLDVLVGRLAQQVERAPGGFVRRDVGLLEPRTVHGQEQVILRTH